MPLRVPFKGSFTGFLLRVPCRVLLGVPLIIKGSLKGSYGSRFRVWGLGLFDLRGVGIQVLWVQGLRV